MNPFQIAFDRLRQTQADYETTRIALSSQVSDIRGLAGTLRVEVQAAAKSCELTYLMRLLSEFEGALTDLGPYLESQLEFNEEDGLSSKLNGIGKRMGMPRLLRERVHRDVRLLRNDLMHGRTQGLTVDFDGAHRLMKEFLRSCR